MNILTEHDDYHLPNISTITDDIRDMRYFWKLDIIDGFFRALLAPETQHKTTYKIEETCYKFVVLPMGYRNAPNIFQRVMENILDKMLGTICRVYIDDILIYSKDLTSCKASVKAVLMKLKEYGMEINWEKSGDYEKGDGIPRLQNWTQ